jgi:hypothetical protein
MRVVIKGFNYTEVITTNKKYPNQESVQFWQLKKRRQLKDTGVWKNGKLISATPDRMLKFRDNSLEKRWETERWLEENQNLNFYQWKEIEQFIEANKKQLAVTIENQLKTLNEKLLLPMKNITYKKKRKILKTIIQDAFKLVKTGSQATYWGK